VGGFLPATVLRYGADYAHVATGTWLDNRNALTSPLVNLLPNNFMNRPKGHSAEGLSASSTRNSTLSNSDFVFGEDLGNGKKTSRMRKSIFKQFYISGVPFRR
jgi:hypothetical protein